MSTTEPEPELNALDQAKHDYDEYRGLARLAAHRLVDEDSDRAARNVQAYAILAVAAAARMQAEAALIALERAERLTQQVQAQLGGRAQVRTGAADDDGLPVFGVRVTALTAREERLVNEAFVAGRDVAQEQAAARAQRRDARDTARHGDQLDGADEVGGPWTDADAPVASPEATP